MLLWTEKTKIFGREKNSLRRVRRMAKAFRLCLRQKSKAPLCAAARLILIDTLRDHRAANLLEARNVRARFKVVAEAELLGGLYAAVPRITRAERG